MDIQRPRDYSTEWELRAYLTVNASQHIQRLWAILPNEDQGMVCVSASYEMNLDQFVRKSLEMHGNGAELNFKLAVCTYQMVRALAFCGNAIHRNIQEFTGIQVSEPWIPIPKFVLCDLSSMCIVEPGEKIEDGHVPYFAGEYPPEWPTPFQHKALDFWCLGITIKRMTKLTRPRMIRALTQPTEQQNRARGFLLAAIEALTCPDPSTRPTAVSALYSNTKDVAFHADMREWIRPIVSRSEERAVERGMALIQDMAVTKPDLCTFSVVLREGNRNEREARMNTARRVLSILGRLRQDRHPNLAFLDSFVNVNTHVAIFASFGQGEFTKFDSRREFLYAGMPVHQIALQVCLAVRHCHDRLGFMLRDLKTEDITIGGEPLRVVLRGFGRACPIRPGWRTYTLLSASNIFRAPEMTTQSGPEGFANYCNAVDVFSIGQIFADLVPKLDSLSRFREDERPTLNQAIEWLQGL